jgi:hypothetical protein
MNRSAADNWRSVSDRSYLLVIRAPEGQSRVAGDATGLCPWLYETAPLGRTRQL